MGLGAEIAASITEACFDELRAPVGRLTMPDVPGIPFTSTLEAALLPNQHTIEREIVALANSGASNADCVGFTRRWTVGAAGFDDDARRHHGCRSCG